MVLEETRCTDKAIRSTNGGRTTEGVESVRKRINRISVVERLGAEGLLKEFIRRLKGRAVVDILVRLGDEDELLARVVEVELDLVRGRTDRLIAGELKLLNQVLVRVLRHAAALVGVQEHVVDVERRGNQRLLVGFGYLRSSGAKTVDGPEALINRAKIEVDLDLVVLEGNERKSKTRVAAVPELERHVEGRLRKSVARGAYVGWDGAITSIVARAINIGKSRVGDVGELGGVANHLVVATLLLLGKGELVPDVHPVAVLAVDALAANLDLDLRDHLLTREIEPAGIDVATVDILANLRKSDLKVGAVREVTVAADGAGDTAAEIGLAVEGLLDRLHREVGVATVGHLPEGDLRVAGKVNVLSAVGYELH